MSDVCTLVNYNDGTPAEAMQYASMNTQEKPIHVATVVRSNDPGAFSIDLIVTHALINLMRRPIKTYNLTIALKSLIADVKYDVSYSVDIVKHPEYIMTHDANPRLSVIALHFVRRNANPFSEKLLVTVEFDTGIVSPCKGSGHKFVIEKGTVTSTE